MSRRSCLRPRAAVAAFVIVSLLGASYAAAEPVITRPFDANADCTGWLDSLGTVVAAGGDYNGDGYQDFAYAAPCAVIGTKRRAGRFWVRSGRNGRILRRAKGLQADMHFGAAIAFVGDLNGDGKDEVAVGAPGFDRTVGASTLTDAGQVRIFSHRRRQPFRRLFGEYARAELGASISAMEDLDGDGVGELLIGAPGEQRSVSDSTRTGVVHLLSGRKGQTIARMTGEKAAQRFGTTVRAIGRYNTDVVGDILVTSERNPVGGVQDAGALEVRSGLDPEVILLRFGGAVNDRLGASSASTGIDGSFIVGVPGRKMGDGLRRAGSVIAYADDRTVQFTVASSIPQNGAQFGTAVAALGDVDGDGVGDYAASEPYLDLPVDALRADYEVDVGRVVVLSGQGGFELYEIQGRQAGNIMGRSLAGSFDFNGDGISDFLSGNPGDSPDGRRGAGSVTVHSGQNGTRLATYRGRRGLETRIVAATVTGGSVRVRGFRANGKRTVLDAQVFNGVAFGNGTLSVAHLERTIKPALPGQARVAVGTGPGATSSDVAVVSASNKQKILGQFVAFPGELVGANVAAGDLDNNNRDDLVVAQASSTTGRVVVKTYQQQANDPFVTTWILRNEFEAFRAIDKFGESFIDANGANVAVAGLRPEVGREIVAAPVLGLPIVRIFDQFGGLLLQWPAYDLDGTVDGLSIALGDLDGDGNQEIITAPTRGQSWIRAFTNDGLPFSMPGAAAPVRFLAFPAQNVAGVRVTTADVDLDGRAEILVVSRRAGVDEIRAYEPDGTEVTGFARIDPFDSSTSIAISATDNFLPK